MANQFTLKLVYKDGLSCVEYETLCIMDGEDAWMYYYDDVVEKIDLSLILKATESVCSALGIKLGKS